MPGISIARSGRKLRRGQHQERAQPAAFCPQFTELVGMQWTHSRGDALDQVEAMPDPCALAALHSQGLIRVQLDLQRPGSLGLDIVLSRDMPQTISTLPNLIKKTLQEICWHPVLSDHLPTRYAANPPGGEDAVGSAPGKCARHPQTKGSIEDAKLSESEEQNSCQ